MWCYILSEPQRANPSVSKFDCKCFRARALLVISNDDIFKTHGIQTLVMLTNDSACISTDRICEARIYQSLRAPTPVSQSLTLSSAFQRRYLSYAWDSETGDAHKRLSVHFYHMICGTTIYQSLRVLTPVSHSLTLSDFQ